MNIFFKGIFKSLNLSYYEIIVITFFCRKSGEKLWIIVQGIQKIDGKWHSRRTHTEAIISGYSVWWKMVGGRPEIRLDVFDIKKSMISFETRRDDSRTYLVSFRPSSRYAVRSYSVLLIIEYAIIVRVCTAPRAISISHQCRLQNPFLLLRLRNATLQRQHYKARITVAVHRAGN